MLLKKTKIKNIEYKIPDITNLATKTILNAKINGIKGEVPSITNVATTAALNAKIKVKNKVPNMTNLATTTTTTTTTAAAAAAALTAVENKIPSVSNLVKKDDYNTKINKTEKNITDHDHD